MVTQTAKSTVSCLGPIQLPLRSRTWPENNAYVLARRCVGETKVVVSFRTFQAAFGVEAVLTEPTSHTLPPMRETVPNISEPGHKTP
ncbi:hypothetical protein, partial [Bradyrhizobium sp. LA7.1]|uniref:hypothetical protein n=1 Tax=Bradyrhizobium sp. LA7.1 TaxID=3156324 RepID=UPI003394B24D